MRKFLLACLFLLLTCYGVMFAQNKTLGVGVATPNPNAALHVESPTANQGFIMPRLTTVQRQAMSALLTAADQGLMLYDSDMYAIFIWDGVAWESSSSFTIDDSTSTSDGLIAATSGLGVAGRFTINNPATFAHAVHAENNGDSTSAAVHGNHTGNGFGVFGRSAGSKFASSAVYGEHVGTGDAAGAFRVSNPANPYSALFGETNGSGPAVYGNQIGLGRAGQFQITNASNTNAAIRSFTSGTGYSGFFTINNTTSTSPGILTTTNGSGAAIVAENTGAADGFAGVFNTTDSANTYPAIQASSAGLGSGVRVMQTTGAGAGIDVFMQNLTSSAVGFAVDQRGRGAAANFYVDNIENAASMIHATTNGQGTAIQVNHNGTGSGLSVNLSNTPLFKRGIDAVHNGELGEAAVFENSNTANSNATIYAISNGDGAQALSAVTRGASYTAVLAQSDGASGNAGRFLINTSNNPSVSLESVTVGTGEAGRFVVNNNLSNATVVSSTTNGMGSAGTFFSTNTLSNAPALQAESISNGGAVKGLSRGPGYAGWFQVTDTASTANALWGSTNGKGTALVVDHSGSTGTIAVFQNNGSNVARIDKSGMGFFNSGTQSSGADVAEMFEVEGETSSYEPGDVLVISEETDRTVEKSNTPNSTRIAGVYATKPGVRLTERNLDENMDDLVPMGVIGVIPTKVCLENGPIKRGDLLVTSSKQGHAMKAIPANINGILIYPTGAIIGKALENFDSNESGLIKVLVNVK